MIEIASSFVRHLRTSAREYVFLVAVGAILAVLLLTAYAALVYALAIAVAREAGPVAAALSIAAGSLLLALLLWVAARLHRKRQQRRRRLRLQRTASVASNSALAAMIPLMVRQSPLGSLLLVGIAAYVLSRAGQRKRDS